MDMWCFKKLSGQKKFKVMWNFYSWQPNNLNIALNMMKRCHRPLKRLSYAPDTVGAKIQTMKQGNTPGKKGEGHLNNYYSTYSVVAEWTWQAHNN